MGKRLYRKPESVLWCGQKGENFWIDFHSQESILYFRFSKPVTNGHAVMKIKICTHRTRARHETIFTLLDEIKKSGFEGIATNSQYRGRHYPVICIGDFTGTVQDRMAPVFLGIAPMRVTGKGQMFHRQTGRFIVPKGERVAVWR